MLLRSIFGTYGQKPVTDVKFYVTDTSSVVQLTSWLS